MTQARTSTKPVLTVEGLTIALPPGADRAHGVADIDLAIARREILCVVGESGSGKSLTSYAIMGLLPKPVRTVGGSIRLEGRDLLAASPSELRRLRGNRMSMIFQEPMTALSPSLTIGRLIEEPLRIHTALGREVRRERVLELMRLVDLPAPERMCARYPHEVSGGQRQRVMIAMALALEPALLIADEPTTALDVVTQSRILDLIKKIQARSDTAVMFVTHDFGIVADIADRVIVMQHGRIVEQGPVDRVVGAPEHPYTRSLIAAIPGMRHRHRPPATNARPAMLEITGLSKIYQPSGLLRRGAPTIAVRQVDLSLRRGETLAIVGESGSGKSTLARCILQLVRASAGRIAIDGVDVLATRSRRAAADLVQIVFQDPNRSLNPRRTVAQSMIEGPRNLGVPAARAMAAAEELLVKVGLGADALHRLPHEFSGGQRQRICIARALSVGPRLLVADEAVSALDVSVQAQVLRLLGSLQQELGLTMLFITHDLRVAVQISDHVAVMRHGEIVEHGPALEVFDAPRHDYTRTLLAAMPGSGFGTVAGTGMTGGL